MNEAQCAKCKAMHCRKEITDEASLPDYCPIKTSKGLIQDVVQRYHEDQTHEFYVKAALTERECYDATAVSEGRVVPVRPRVREIVEFAKKLGVKKMGMAFCSGLADEAAKIASIFERHNLDLCSVICSCGAIDKTELGVPAENKVWGEDKFEAGCNPLLQAAVLEKAETEINLLVGLCVGHDMLFTMSSKAPVTTLIVKDRLTGHNPVASLYSRYYRHVR